ncbi:MFS transporter [Nonomuraea sp. NPDC059194]|uniref:MFS transporter n=1 Tax=Nonomuraea sp. NPDC059194 TaxID=3346764 RepID=UPI0036C23F8B
MSLWRNRNFSLFLVIQALSVAGDSFSLIAIPLLVLRETGSVVQMGLMTGLSGVASLVAGAFAGLAADRLDRRRLLIACDVARAALYALVPLAWIFSPQIWLLYVVVPLGAALGMVFQVTYVTVVPRLVDKERLTEANGRLYAVYAAASVGGPALAGLASQRYGPTVALGIDAASFAISALGLCLVRLRPAEAPAGKRGGFLDGARFLWRHPVLRWLTILLTFFIFLTAGLDDIVIYYLKHDLGQNDDAVGVVLACGAVGSLAGAAVVARVRGRLGFGPTWIAAVAVSGTAVACLGLAPQVPGIAAIMAGFLLGSAIAGICSQTLRQEITPDHLLGRVTSAFWTIHFALGPLGAALLTLAASRYGAPEIALAAGAAIVGTALVGMLTPVRSPHPEPDPST